LIRDGLSRLGTFHLKKPLRVNKQGQVVSENFLLLYFYHNRMEGYDLEKKIFWENIRPTLVRKELEKS
jgi:glycerol-3-phosphate O-acyltransferase